jgi:hypothetical protein
MLSHTCKNLFQTKIRSNDLSKAEALQGDGLYAQDLNNVKARRFDMSWNDWVDSFSII